MSTIELLYRQGQMLSNFKIKASTIAKAPSLLGTRRVNVLNRREWRRWQAEVKFSSAARSWGAMARGGGLFCLAIATAVTHCAAIDLTPTSGWLNSRSERYLCLDACFQPHGGTEEQIHPTPRLSFPGQLQILYFQLLETWTSSPLFPWHFLLS